MTVSHWGRSPCRNCACGDAATGSSPQWLTAGSCCWCIGRRRAGQGQASASHARTAAHAHATWGNEEAACIREAACVRQHPFFRRTAGALTTATTAQQGRLQQSGSQAPPCLLASYPPQAKQVSSSRATVKAPSAYIYIFSTQLVATSNTHSFRSIALPAPAATPSTICPLVCTHHLVLPQAFPPVGAASKHDGPPPGPRPQAAGAVL